MASVEEELWEEMVRPLLMGQSAPALTKGPQMQLAGALQSWVARSIGDRLGAMLPAADVTGHALEHFTPKSKGRSFLGGMRWQEVDVWIAADDFGLALAADPKHFQSQDSLKKNWKNGHNDLVAFATNLHERFPMCAIAGIIAFPAHAAADTQLRQMERICERSIPRERPLNAYGKFEAFAIVRYSDVGALDFPFGASSELSAERAFSRLAEIVFSRFVATYAT